MSYSQNTTSNPPLGVRGLTIKPQAAPMPGTIVSAVNNKNGTMKDNEWQWFSRVWQKSSRSWRKKSKSYWWSIANDLDIKEKKYCTSDIHYFTSNLDDKSERLGVVFLGITQKYH